MQLAFAEMSKFEVLQENEIEAKKSCIDNACKLLYEGYKRGDMDFKKILINLLIQRAGLANQAVNMDGEKLLKRYIYFLNRNLRKLHKIKNEHLIALNTFVELSKSECSATVYLKPQSASLKLARYFIIRLENESSLVKILQDYDSQDELKTQQPLYSFLQARIEAENRIFIKKSALANQPKMMEINEDNFLNVAYLSHQYEAQSAESVFTQEGVGAITKLAIMYDVGAKGIAVDHLVAVKLLEQAASYNDSVAIVYLGHLYLAGRKEVAISLDKAAELFKRVANLKSEVLPFIEELAKNGHFLSCLNLIMLYSSESSTFSEKLTLIEKWIMLEEMPVAMLSEMIKEINADKAGAEQINALLDLIGKIKPELINSVDYQYIKFKLLLTLEKNELLALEFYYQNPLILASLTEKDFFELGMAEYHHLNLCQTRAEQIFCLNNTCEFIYQAYIKNQDTYKTPLIHFLKINEMLKNIKRKIQSDDLVLACYETLMAQKNHPSQVFHRACIISLETYLLFTPNTDPSISFAQELLLKLKNQIPLTQALEELHYDKHQIKGRLSTLLKDWHEPEEYPALTNVISFNKPYQ